MKKSKDYISLVFFLAGAILIFCTSFHYFHIKITGIIGDKSVASAIWYNVILRIHIVFGLIAIFVGPFQLVKSFRERKINLHKKLGYTYAISVLISGLTGLVVAQFAIGGIISSVGFSTLAILWIYSLQKSIKSIRNKKIVVHRKWMFINYGLTFAAIPQRFFLALALITDIGFINIYRMSAWFPWMISVAIALILANKISKKESLMDNKCCTLISN